MTGRQDGPRVTLPGAGGRPQDGAFSHCSSMGFTRQPLAATTRLVQRPRGKLTADLGSRCRAGPALECTSCARTHRAGCTLRSGPTGKTGSIPASTSGRRPRRVESRANKPGTPTRSPANDEISPSGRSVAPGSWRPGRALECESTTSRATIEPRLARFLQYFCDAPRRLRLRTCGPGPGKPTARPPPLPAEHPALNGAARVRLALLRSDVVFRQVDAATLLLLHQLSAAFRAAPAAAPAAAAVPARRRPAAGAARRGSPTADATTRTSTAGPYGDWPGDPAFALSEQRHRLSRAGTARLAPHGAARSPLPAPARHAARSARDSARYGRRSDRRCRPCQPVAVRGGSSRARSRRSPGHGRRPPGRGRSQAGCGRGPRTGRGTTPAAGLAGAVLGLTSEDGQPQPQIEPPPLVLGLQDDERLKRREVVGQLGHTRPEHALVAQLGQQKIDRHGELGRG